MCCNYNNLKKTREFLGLGSTKKNDQFFLKIFVVMVVKTIGLHIKQYSSITWTLFFGKIYRNCSPVCLKHTSLHIIMLFLQKIGTEYGLNVYLFKKPLLS